MKRRMTALTLAVVLAASMLAGCGKTPEAEKKAREKTEAVDSLPIEKRPQVSITIFDRGSCPADEGTMEENRWTKLLREKSGVNVKWIAIPRDKANDKINMLTAAGDPPDMIANYDSNYMYNMVEQGGIIALDDLLKQYGQNILKLTPPEILNTFKVEGKQYAIPQVRVTPAYGVYLVRKDWLENLKMSAPKTTEELFELLKAFVLKDPDGNGKADTFGMNMRGKNNSDPFNTLRLSFVKPGWSGQPNGTLLHEDISEGKKEYLKFLRRMYEEKLINPEYVVDTQGNKEQQFIETGKVGIVNTIHANVVPFNEALKKNIPGAELTPMIPPKGTAGLQGTLKNSGFKMFTVISDKCKYPQEAVKFLDFMITEGWKYTERGMEGVNYKMQDGFVLKSEFVEVNKKTFNYMNGDYTYLVNPKQEKSNYESAKFDASIAKDPETKRNLELKAEALKIADDYGVQAELELVPPLQSIKEYSSELSKLAGEWDSKLIMGTVPFEEGWKTFVSEWNKRGGEQMTKEMNEWYKKNKK